MEADPKANCYITNVPETLTEDALRAIFNSYGTIVRQKIAVHPGTGIRQGYAFVQFETVDSAQKAIAALNGFEIDKKKLRVSLAKTKDSSSSDSKEGRTNLYIVGLPPSYTKLELDTIFSAYGKVVGSRVMTTPTGESRRAGFVRYESAESAQRAIDAVNGTVPAGFKDPLTVQYAREKDSPAAKFLPYGVTPRLPVPFSPYGAFPPSPYPTPFGAISEDGATNLYIVGLPESFSKLELDGLFAPYGRVLGSRILKQPSGTTKGVSFVRLDQQEGAIQAIQVLNGSIPPKGTEAIVVKLAKNQAPTTKQKAAQPTVSLPPTNPYGPVKTPAKQQQNFRYTPLGRPSPATVPISNPYEATPFNGNYHQQPAGSSFQGSVGGYPTPGQQEYY